MDWFVQETTAKQMPITADEKDTLAIFGYFADFGFYRENGITVEEYLEDYSKLWREPDYATWSYVEYLVKKYSLRYFDWLGYINSTGCGEQETSVTDEILLYLDDCDEETPDEIADAMYENTRSQMSVEELYQL